MWLNSKPAKTTGEVAEAAPVGSHIFFSFNNIPNFLRYV